MNIYTSAPSINYHETRRMKSSLKKNIHEMKVIGDRIKRGQSIKTLLSMILTNFVNFKYPRFSTFLLTFIMIYCVFFSFLTLVGFAVVIFLIYFNPILKVKIDKYL